MATERQIEANRRNALASTGPTSVEGKERSRGNSTTHGMSGAGIVVASTRSEEFQALKEVWIAEFRPQTVEGMFALDRAVAAVLRVEECDRSYHAVIKGQAIRAQKAWVEDRRTEARILFAKLHDNPALIIPDLESKRYGVELLLELWARLADPHYINNDWSDYDRSLALDLLGVPLEGREGKTPVDPRDGLDVRPFRRHFVEAQIERLQRLKDRTLDELDEIDRAEAETGVTAILSKPASLILRYEREATRSFHRAIREITKPNAATAVEPQQSRPAEVANPQARPEVAAEPRVEASESRSSRDDAPVSRQASPSGPRNETNPISTAPTTREPRNRHERRAMEAQNRRR